MNYLSKIGDPKDQNRVPLYKVVPLKMPFSLGVSPSDVCNFRCRYCIQATQKKYKGGRIITWDDWLERAKQIETLCEKGGVPLKVLRFTGYGEPLMNSNLPDMISYVKKRNLANRIEVTTNASLLTSELSKKIIDAGLTRLLISIQGLTQKSYITMSDYNMDYNKFLDNIKLFYEMRNNCKVYIKIMDVEVPTKEDKRQFYEMFGPICDMMSVEHMINAYDGVDYERIAHRNIDKENRYGYNIEERICCDTLFEYMTIDSQGNVDVCGCTYPPNYIGNIYKMTLDKMWNGPRHRKLMLLHLTGRRKEIPACERCHSITQYAHPLDNLDEHLDDILKRI